MIKERKEKIVIYSAVFMLLFGALLTAVGFCVTPVGEVHDSVLYVLGQSLVYAGSAFGLATYAVNLKRGIDRRFEEFERRQHDATDGEKAGSVDDAE